MVGYRCNFKNWPPIKIWGPQTPSVVTQSRRTWSKLILPIGHENEYPKLVSKFWGLPPPKKIWGGQSLEISILKLAFLRGHGSHSLQIFTNGSGSRCVTYVPLGGPSAQKKFFWGKAKIFPNPLGSGGVVQTFPGNSPWKDVPKTGFKFLGGG